MSKGVNIYRVPSRSGRLLKPDRTFRKNKRKAEEETVVTQKPRFLGPLKGTNKIAEGQRAHFEVRVEPQNDVTMKVINGVWTRANYKRVILNAFYPANRRSNGISMGEC